MMFHGFVATARLSTGHKLCICESMVFYEELGPGLVVHWICFHFGYLLA
jgi:hypothetical protein